MPHWKQFDDYIKLVTREPDEEEIQRRWFNAREVVLYRAVYASTHSISYRPFPVGCAVWGYKPNAHFSERWNVYKGANIKPAKEVPKICAEMTAVMGAMQDGFSRIVGMSIVGQPREEDTAPTLHPCEQCRLTFKSMPLIRPDTWLLLARPKGEDEFDIEEMTMQQMWDLHEGKRAEE